MNFTQDITQTLKNILENAGFLAVENFTAVDSLIHKDEDMAFYSLKSCEKYAECISVDTADNTNGTDGTEYFMELECEFEIRLMGKSGDFCDYKEFDNKCTDFYTQAAENENLLLKTIKMGKVCQSMPLKRLQRDVSLTVKILVEEKVEE